MCVIISLQKKNENKRITEVKARTIVLSRFQQKPVAEILIFSQIISVYRPGCLI